MTMFHRIRQAAALTSAMLLIAAINAHADDIQDANKLFKQGQYSPALDKVEAILKDKPKDAKARFLKGLILTEQGKSEAAIAVFSAMTDDFPDLPEAYNNLAMLYAIQGKYDKAKNALETAIRNNPKYSLAHENLGDIYAAMASKEYERAMQLDPNNPSPQSKRAIVKQLYQRNTRKPAPVVAPAAPADPASQAASAPAAAPATKH